MGRFAKVADPPVASEQSLAVFELPFDNNIPVTQLSLTRARFVTSAVQFAGMENGILKLTLDEDGLGADLLLATPARTVPADEVLATLYGMNLRTRVKTHTRGSKGWLLQVRVSEYEGLRLSAGRSQDILRELGHTLAAINSAPLRATCAA